MPDFVYVLQVVVAFALVIFVHELGHFLAAKWCGVHVRKFAIGFGPPLVKWQPGETEYSLRPIPLGGFVDLAGEHPDVDEEDNPRALWRRPAWQRATVFSAGVAMNAVLALVLFTVAPMVGMKVPAPVIGDVEAGSPAAEAGIQPGDRILRINDEKVQSFQDVQFVVVLGGKGTSHRLTLERPGGPDGSPRRLQVTAVSRQGQLGAAIGVGPECKPEILGLAESSLAAQAGLEEGDRILAVGGRPVETARGLRAALEDVPAGPLTLKIERDGQTQDLRVDPSDLKTYEHGMQWPVRVKAVVDDSPAEKAGIEAGDRVAAVADTAWPDMDTLVETIQAAGAGNPVRLVLWRDGKRVEVTARPEVAEGEEKPRIGIHLEPALDEPVQVGSVEDGGPAEQAGIRPGDVIVGVGENGKAPDDWNSLLERLWRAQGKPVPLTLRRGESEVTATYRPEAVPHERLALPATQVQFQPLYVPLPRIGSPVAAAKRGIRRTLVWFHRIYLNLKLLATGDLTTKSLGGPVMIARISYQQASHGPGTFMNFWAMISVMLAVVNFLPVPPFDGGHVLFVLIEKLKGGPVSMKVRGAIWGAGWLAVLALFLLITWQDISRLIGAW
ncbi:MAG: RIP metalloprotease RseP [Phycisphaerae bacterium]